MSLRIRMATVALGLGAAALALLPGCVIGRPFRGPGFERGRVTLPIEGESVVVALTRGRLDRSKRRAFDRNIPRVEEALEDAPGLVGYSLRKELFGSRVWTMTVWSDEASMRAFVRGQVHRTAMREGSAATEKFEFASATVPAAEIPMSWEWAEALLDEESEDYVERTP